MASHRTLAAHAAISTTHPTTTSPTAPASSASDQASLKRAALYTRISTESGKLAILPSEVEPQTSVYGTAFITLEFAVSKG